MKARTGSRNPIPPFHGYRQQGNRGEQTPKIKPLVLNTGALLCPPQRAVFTGVLPKVILWMENCDCIWDFRVVTEQIWKGNFLKISQWKASEAVHLQTDVYQFPTSKPSVLVVLEEFFFASASTGPLSVLSKLLLWRHFIFGKLCRVSEVSVPEWRRELVHGDVVVAVVVQS